MGHNNSIMKLHSLQVMHQPTQKIAEMLKQPRLAGLIGEMEPITLRLQTGSDSTGICRKGKRIAEDQIPGTLELACCQQTGQRQKRTQQRRRGKALSSRKMHYLGPFCSLEAVIQATSIPAECKREGVTSVLVVGLV